MGGKLYCEILDDYLRDTDGKRSCAQSSCSQMPPARAPTGARCPVRRPGQHRQRGRYRQQGVGVGRGKTGR